MNINLRGSPGGTRRGGRRGRRGGSGRRMKRPRSPGSTPENAKEPKWTEDIFGPLDNTMETARSFIDEDAYSEMEDIEREDSEMEVERKDEEEVVNDKNKNEEDEQEIVNVDEGNYRRLEKLGNIAINTLINKIDKDELKYFTFLEEVNEIDEIIKLYTFDKLKMFYIPYMGRSEINRLNGPTNRNVISNKGKNKKAIRFRNDERGREWLLTEKVKGSRKRFSKPRQLSHSISVVAMNTTKEIEIFLDVIGKSLNNCYEGINESFVMVEHQNLCRLIIHLNEEMFNNMKQLMTKETNIFLEHFPGKFRKLINEKESYAVAFMSTNRYNSFIYNSINNYIGVTFRFYGSLGNLLANDKKFVYIRKVVANRRAFYICIPANKETKEKIFRGMNKDYIEPFFPVNVIKDVKNLLGETVKLIEVCSKEYICEGGCSQFNRGDRGSRCNSGKLHIEDDDLRKDLYLLCKKGLYIEEDWIPKSKPTEGPSYSNKVYKMKSSRNYLKALTQPKKIDTIMLTDESSLLRIENYTGKNSTEVLVELRAILNNEKVSQVIEKIELIGEKVNVIGDKPFGAILLKSEMDAINFKNLWDMYSVLTNQEIKINRWLSIKDKIKGVQSPNRKKRITVESESNDKLIKELTTRIHEIDIRSRENAKKFDSLEMNLRRMISNQHEELQVNLKKLINNNKDV